MTVLETTAIVRNHRLVIDIEVPESVADGTPLRVTVAPANDDPNPVEADELGSRRQVIDATLRRLSEPGGAAFPDNAGNGKAILAAMEAATPGWRGTSADEVEAWRAELLEERGFEED